MRNETLGACIVALLGIGLFTTLLLQGKLSEATYAVLLSVLAFICLVLMVFHRLRELDLKNLKLTLHQMKDVRAEVFAKEKDLRDISLHLARIIAANNAFQGRIGNRDSMSLKKRWYYLRTRELLDLLGLVEEEKDDILKYYGILHKYDDLIEQKDAIRKTAQRQTLLDTMKRDIEALSEKYE